VTIGNVLVSDKSEVLKLTFYFGEWSKAYDIHGCFGNVLWKIAENISSVQIRGS